MWNPSPVSRKLSVRHPVICASIRYERDPEEKGHEEGDAQPQPAPNESAKNTKHGVAPTEAQSEDRGCREASTNEDGNRPRPLRTRIGYPSPNGGNRENDDRKKQKRAKTHAEGRLASDADRHSPRGASLERVLACSPVAR
jgi:hypothetical protein